VLRKRVVEELEFEPENITSPLDGNELMAILNVGPCRAIGDIKNYLTDLVVEGVIAPDDKARARTLAEMRYEEITGKD
jgi:poly(A) polymerase